MARSKRRANGEGSIWQRADGRWAAAVYVPTPAGGEKRKYVYGRTREEVHRKAQDLLRARRDGTPVPDGRLTVADYLTEWLAEVVKVQRRPKTYQGYEGVVRLHLIPGLGKKRLARLTAREVRTFVADVRTACQCCRHGWDAKRAEPRCCAAGECCSALLSTRMVQSIHAVLRNALEDAVREELIPRNVAKLVRVATPTYTVGRGLSVKDARLLLRLSREDRLHALYVLALTLGLRRGELLGLHWVNVDLDAGALEVVWNLQRVGGELRLVPPKTRHSLRTVPLPELCLAALREHRKQQMGERLAAGGRWVESGLVFTTSIGSPIEPDNLRRSWYPLREAAGIGAVRFHDLRHTCVTLLLDLGVPPHIVQEIVGHADTGVTMTIYAHASREERVKALRKLGDALG